MLIQAIYTLHIFIQSYTLGTIYTFPNNNILSTTNLTPMHIMLIVQTFAVQNVYIVYTRQCLKLLRYRIRRSGKVYAIYMQMKSVYLTRNINKCMEMRIYMVAKPCACNLHRVETYIHGKVEGKRDAKVVIIFILT